MIERLKVTLARRPLVWFFWLTGAVYAASLAFAAAPSSGLVLGQVWLNRFHLGSELVYVGVAIVCFSASSAPRDRRPSRSAQALLLIAGTVLVMVVSCAQIWVQWRVFQVNVTASGFSLSSEIGRQLRDPWNWLYALAVGLVLAAAVSPVPALRRGALAVVRGRGRHVWPLIAVALLVPAACALAARLGVLFVRFSADASTRTSVTLIAVQTLGSLLWYLPIVFVFYGFVAERLQARLSPLATGLIIGAAVTGSYQLGWWIVNVRLGVWYPYNTPIVLSELRQFAVALPALWLARRSGSLPPAWLLLGAAATAQAIVEWTNTSQPRMTRADELYSLAVIAAAALFVIAGRMWRRPDVAPAALAPDAPAPSPGGHGVTVHDVSMPA